MKDMHMTISMTCSICGNDQFSRVDESVKDAGDEIEVKCSDCGRVITKEQLIEENRYIIDANVDDFKDDIIKEIQKKFN